MPHTNNSAMIVKQTAVDILSQFDILYIPEIVMIQITRHATGARFLIDGQLESKALKLWTLNVRVSYTECLAYYVSEYLNTEEGLAILAQENYVEPVVELPIPEPVEDKTFRQYVIPHFVAKP